MMAGAAQRILVIGGDGYCGWGTSLFLSARGYEVGILDSLVRRSWDAEHGIRSLTPIAPIDMRLAVWRARTGKQIPFYHVDLADYDALADALRAFRPDAIVHFGEQRSAPFSMLDREHALLTQVGNLTGTLNILFAMRDIVPDVHLVKLGTMGEYGTPNIDIEEGYIEIEHNGRKDVLPYPKQPGSIYHLSKVHDSDNISFACRVWKLRATDLNQGVVYGQSDETAEHADLVNRFDYDQLFGTVLNRFCVEAVLGHPLSVYGKGGQTRGFIDLRDTCACIEIAVDNPPAPGRLEVINQFTEQFSVQMLADRVKAVSEARGRACEIEHRENPRVELEEHYYNAKHTKLIELGLTPHMLNDETVGRMLDLAETYRRHVIPETIDPHVQWARVRSSAGARPNGSAG
jgi:UDP-sulfoquinovose synthase